MGIGFIVLSLILICETFLLIRIIVKNRHTKEKLKREEEIIKEKALNEAKSSFLTHMSHEIRTPINAILGMNEMIIRESKDKTIISHAKNIEDSSKALLGLVDEILDYSRLESGDLKINPIQYRFDNLINEVLSLTYEKAKAKGLCFDIHINPEIPLRMYGDVVRIKECLLNLLTNSIKYTKEGSVSLRIDFKKLDSENVELYVIISDSGVGIKKEDLYKLNNAFTRLDEINNSSIEGMGLGLSLTSRLLEMMDSKLEIESVYGLGTTFAFSLKQLIVGWLECGDVVKNYEDSLCKINKYKKAFRASKANILVVDDVEVNANVVKGLLSRSHVKLDIALSGEEALEKAKLKKYDIIFLDHRMPKMDGEETLKKLREDKESLSFNSPVIVLTANVFNGVRDIYIEKGFTDYLAKPVFYEKLERLLIKYLPEDKIDNNDLADSSLESAVANDAKSGSDLFATWDFYSFENDSDSQILSLFGDISYIDYEQALRNCMTRNTLINSIITINSTLLNNLEKLESYYKAEDYANLEILVHGLKSSLKLIGALEISGQAAHIEDLCKSQNYKNLDMEYDALCVLLTRLKADLENVLSPLKDDNKKELISKEQLSEAYLAIKEYAEIGDFRNVDQIMKHLLDYEIPGNEREKFEKVKEYSLNVDAKGLLEIL